MARRNQFSRKRQRTPPSPSPKIARPVWEKKPPVQYGKPFVVLEDGQKNTFVFQAGHWVAYSMSIAECREECQVKELPQRVNGMVRFEIRCPVAMNS